MHRFAFAVAGAPIIGGTLALALAPTLHRGVIRPLDDDVSASSYDNAGRVATPASISGSSAAAARGSRDRNGAKPTSTGWPSRIDSDPKDSD